MCSAAFIPAGVSYDQDTDKKHRAENPNFYGCIPDDTMNRIKVFTCCFTISACQLTTKALACSLCGVQNMFTAFMYLGVNMGCFFLYKLCRGDLTTPNPIYGVLSVVISFLERFCHKTVTDFTANVHMRSNYCLGGLYWTFTILSTPVVCLVFGARYLTYIESDAGKERELPFILTATQVYGVIGGLIVLEAMAFVVYFNTIIPKYISSFYSMRTGHDSCKRKFLNHEDDDKYRLNILTNNRKKWRSIENDVAEWVIKKIPEWNESQPEWWNAQKKSIIPDWVVLDAEVLQTIRITEVKRSRQSIFQMVMSLSFSEHEDQDDDNDAETSLKKKAQR